MRCQCCNRILNDYEATMRHPEHGGFLDICARCLPDTGIRPVVRNDLKPELVEDEEDDFFFELDEDDES